jgi:Tol biopolymer transport system component
VVTGNPISVVDPVANASRTVVRAGLGADSGAAQFTVSDDGLLAYVEAGSPVAPRRTLVWVDRNGRETPVPGLPVRSYAYPRISPDGKRVALDIRDEDEDIWVFEFESQTLSRLTFDPATEIAPLWTPDGQRIAYFRNGQGLFWQPADGTGSPEQLTTSGTNVHGPAAFTRDGRRLLWDLQVGINPDPSLLGRLGGPSIRNTKVIDLESRDVTDLEANPRSSMSNASLSPDGRWLAAQAGRTVADSEIVVRPFPDIAGGRWEISRGGGGRIPLWSRDGRELFYVAPGSPASPGPKFMAVPVDTTTTFRLLGTPTELSTGPFFAALERITYDVAADGRFLMIRVLGGTNLTAPRRIVVVDNWFEELKERVPVP